MMDCDLLYTKWGLPSAAVFSQKFNSLQYGILSKMFFVVARKQHKNKGAPTHPCLLWLVYFCCQVGANLKGWRQQFGSEFFNAG